MIDELIVEGVTVVMRFHSEGIHTGELFGVPSNDKKIVINGRCIYRTNNGKVVEAFIYDKNYGRPNIRELSKMLGFYTCVQ